MSTMGNYIAAHEGLNGRMIASASIGTNGSGEYLCKVFLAGYAASPMPEARRAIRWLRPMSGAVQHNHPSAIPKGLLTSRQDVVKLIALNGGGCGWVDVDIRQLTTGYCSKIPTCPTLRALCFPLVHGEMIFDGGVVPPSWTIAIAQAWRSVLPFLQQSPWRQKCEDAASVAQAAAAVNGSLTIS